MGLVYTHYLGNHALQQAVYFWNTIEEYNKEAINHGIEEAVNPPILSRSQLSRKESCFSFVAHAVCLRSTSPAQLCFLLCYTPSFLPSFLEATGYRSIGVIRLLPPHALPATPFLFSNAGRPAGRPIPIPSINHLVLVFSNK